MCRTRSVQRYRTAVSRVGSRDTARLRRRCRRGRRSSPAPVTTGSSRDLRTRWRFIRDTPCGATAIGTVLGSGHTSTPDPDPGLFTRPDPDPGLLIKPGPDPDLLPSSGPALFSSPISVSRMASSVCPIIWVMHNSEPTKQRQSRAVSTYIHIGTT